MRTTETIYKTTGDNYQIKIWDVINKKWICRQKIMNLLDILRVWKKNVAITGKIHTKSNKLNCKSYSKWTEIL